MSTFTENYDFIKPDNEDYYDIQDFNENMDAIDAPQSPSYGGTLTIQEITPEKTFVITERLNNISNSLVNFSYTLSSNAITIKHTGCNVDVVKIGFWVVEFV